MPQLASGHLSPTHPKDVDNLGGGCTANSIWVVFDLGGFRSRWNKSASMPSETSRFYPYQIKSASYYLGEKHYDTDHLFVNMR